MLDSNTLPQSCSLTLASASSMIYDHTIMWHMIWHVLFDMYHLTCIIWHINLHNIVHVTYNVTYYVYYNVTWTLYKYHYISLLGQISQQTIPCYTLRTCYKQYHTIYQQTYNKLATLYSTNDTLLQTIPWYKRTCLQVQGRRHVYMYVYVQS